MIALQEEVEVEYVTEQQLVALSKALYLISKRTGQNESVLGRYFLSSFTGESIYMDTIQVQDRRGLTVLFYNNLTPNHGVTWNGTKDIFLELWQHVADLDDYTYGIHAVKR